MNLGFLKFFPPYTHHGATYTMLPASLTSSPGRLPGNLSRITTSCPAISNHDGQFSIEQYGPWMDFANSNVWIVRHGKLTFERQVYKNLSDDCVLLRVCAKITRLALNYSSNLSTVRSLASKVLLRCQTHLVRGLRAAPLCPKIFLDA